MRGKDRWLLPNVFKPHSRAVTAAEFSADGKLLATGGAGGTVFLLKVRPSSAADGLGRGEAPDPEVVVQLHKTVKSLPRSVKRDIESELPAEMKPTPEALMALDALLK